MDYLDSIDWKEIKKDLQKGMEKGMAAMKKGAIVAQKKAESSPKKEAAVQIIDTQDQGPRGGIRLGRTGLFPNEQCEGEEPRTRRWSEGPYGQDQGP